MTVLETPFTGCHVIAPKVVEDSRGNFVKTFHREQFITLGVKFELAEEFYSTSRAGVVRGMHFQIPPHDLNKIVYCSQGRVLDVFLDLRKSSPTYGKAASMELSASNRKLVFIPTGVAHGFLSREENSVVVYKTDAVHAPNHDRGVLWNSFGFDWGVSDPLLSQRDADLPALSEFASPF